ncbi:MAG: penicillin-binding protein 1C [bacterium]|nr:penicillin-binding protein 1C [bacterium]
MNTRRWSRVRRAAALLLAAACLACGAVWYFACRTFPASALQHWPISSQILDINGTVLRQGLAANDTRCYPVALSNMGAWTARALLAAEDRRFFAHHGVDGWALARAAFLNARLGRVASGGSTLSMQVMRMAVPRRRTIRAKLIEALHAVVLETRCTKNNIIELHLNRASFGGNLVGIEAASRQYFGKAAQDLSLGESALLIGLLQAPTRLRPDRHLARARERRDYVFTRMRAVGMISEAERIAAAQQPLVIRATPAVALAPHFCNFMLERQVVAARSGSVRTTLDTRLQQLVGATVATYTSAMAHAGVHGCAVVVLDVRTGALAAMLGAPRFADAAHAGQVNCALAPRSPGSALKPFVYAMAFEQGLLTPATVLQDAPMQFGTYEPENFTKDFHGPVSVQEALALSLNIPAVQVAQQLGPTRVVNWLQACGISTLTRPVATYGLGTVLGACEVTLLELANAYACLARGGLYLPVRLNADEPSSTGTRLLSPEACWLVSAILGDSQRANNDGLAIPGTHMPRIAWKTGTSSGLRDAWTVAYNPDWVVAVWCGNADGAAAHSLIGYQRAAPIAFDIFQQLYTGAADAAPWFMQPAGITSRLVCAHSGLPACPTCPRNLTSWCIAGISDPRPCATHSRTAAPAAPLRILSPARDITYHLHNDRAPGDNTLVLRADATGSQDLHWFVDDIWLGVSAPNAALHWPLQRGPHVIACADTRGHTDALRITVE